VTTAGSRDALCADVLRPRTIYGLDVAESGNAEVVLRSVGAFAVNAIFTKLDLAEEPSVHRRVAAVLAYLSEAPAR
jgi:hypothetical protein